MKGENLTNGAILRIMYRRSRRRRRRNWVKYARLEM